MAKFDVINRKGSIRKFPGDGRYLTLAGGESARGIELTDAEKSALEACGDFHVREVKDADYKAPAQATTFTAKPPKE